MSRARYTFYSVVIVCCLILLYLFLVRGMDFFLVPSASMEPLIVKGDYILTFQSKQYRRGDVVVFDDPINKGEFMVKRIVAVGGDRVELDGGALHLNGEYVSEPYVKEPLFLNTEALTVPAGCCFVMGDNRQHSEDSSSEAWRAGGWECSPCIDMDTIIGKVHRIYLPLDRWGPVKSATLRSYPSPQEQP